MRCNPALVASSLLASLLVACSGGTGNAPPREPEPTMAASEPEAPPAKAVWATIEVLSSPAGMEVLLDGKPVGKTPVTLDKVMPGSHDVTYKDAANGDATYTLEVGEGEYKTQKHNVVPRADRAAPANARQ